MRKSIFQCMKCGGISKMRWGGGHKKKPTIKEINEGLPMKQLAGEFMYKSTPEDIAAPGPNPYLRQAPAPQFYPDYDDAHKNQMDYTRSVDELRAQNPGSYFDNDANFQNPYRRDLNHLPFYLNSAFRLAANTFGPQSTGYEFNPLQTLSIGQQHYGDTQVAEEGGEIFRRGGMIGSREAWEWITLEARRRDVSPREMIHRILLNEDRYSEAAVRRANIASKLLKK